MKKILFIILVFAFVLRFYKLDSYPALNADEASIGYNAYSLLLTGKDEHGNPWPVHFQSFNDYKPGFYFYLVLPFIKLFGLNELSVRLPGALAGVVAVLLIYSFASEIIDKQEKKSEAFPLLAAFFLAINPWHIHFSRGAWEVNLATTLILAGVVFFQKSFRKPVYLVISAVIFVLACYTYHSARIVAPLLVISLSLIYFNKVRTMPRQVVSGILIGLILLIPLTKDIFNKNTFSRAAGVGLFADPGPINRINEQRGEHGNYKDLLAKTYHNKFINYGLTFLENWAEHYNGEFLFVSGEEIQRNKVPETGQFFLFDIVFLILGIVYIVKKPGKWKIVVSWLIIAPVAAALTFQSPHALRSHNMIIPMTLIIAYGFYELLIRYNSRGFYVFLGVLTLWQFARYEHMYWVHMGKEYPYSSQYGLRELVNYVSEKGKSKDKIIVTTKYDQPYILFLFYLKYPPDKFQKEHILSQRDKFGFSTVEHFDKYYFMPIIFDDVRPQYPNSLIIGSGDDIPDEANVIKKIYFPDGDIAFKVVVN
jgi:4-amino-4-deoxy-L-arabinose transferase-like glycosyltransferase